MRRLLAAGLVLAAGAAGGQPGFEGWEQHCAPGSRIDVRGGTAAIRARLNTHAYLSRAAGSDLMTLRARIRPGSPDAGVSWATSAFLYWRGRDWCQLGMIAAPDGSGGRYYVAEMVEGAPRETYLAPAALDRSHYVRIALGRDCIRYSASEDGRAWRPLRVTERPRSFAGAPSLVAVGKGYASGAAPHDHPGLANDYTDPGPEVVSEVSGVGIGPTRPGDMRLSVAERRRAALQNPGMLDPVGEVELAGAADPTYERVARHYPPMRYPRELVGVPSHPDGIGVDHLGRLELGVPRGSRMVWLETESGPLATGAPPLRRRLAGGYLPIVMLTGRSGAVAFEQTALGYTPGLRPEGELAACVRLNLRAAPGGLAPAHVWLARTGGPRTQFATTRSGAGGAVVCLRIPYHHPEQAAAVAPAAFEALLAETGRTWRRLLGQGTQIRVPEARVNNAWRAWLAYSMLNVRRVNGYEEPHDGTGFYDEVYGYSALLYARTLDRYGRHDLARSVLAMALHKQQPDGLYTENFGLPDQGGLLLALADHYRLTGDRAWLRSAAPAMVRAADWIVRQREAAPKEGVAAGLIKFRPYCDFAGQTYDYLGDTYCCTGLAAAAEVLPAAGLGDDAQRLRAEASRYRADVLRSMDAAAVKRDGFTVLPLEPETQRVEKDSRWRGGEYYGLIASPVLETEFLPADDRRARLITDLMERRGGLLAGNCRFDNGIDHAYTYGYLLTRLKRGDARRYLLGFYGMLAYGMTRDTFAGVEVTHMLTGDNYGTLPHLYSCTQQLQTLRTMLLREDGEALHIGEAVPRAWLSDAKRVSVDGAATRFGDLSYTIVSHAKVGRIDVSLDPPGRVPARRIVVHLRHPDGLTIRSVSVDGRPWKRFRGETVDLGSLRKPVRVVVLYR